MKRFVTLLPLFLVACGGGGTSLQSTSQPATIAETPVVTTTVASAQPPILTTAPTPVEAAAINPSVPPVTADTSSIPPVTAADGVAKAEAVVPAERLKHITKLTEKSRGK